MVFVEKEVKNEIMATDVYIGIASETANDRDLKEAIKVVFDEIRSFEKRFSRFIPNNELAQFNVPANEVHISADLLEMLKFSKYYYEKTDGIFDICILETLLKEGYRKSKTKDFYDPGSEELPESEYSISNIKIDELTSTVIKPKNLTIDLGGIGKGYIVKKVAEMLCIANENFIVDAGGDMYVAGKDLKHKYDYWAVDIENPLDSSESLATLMVSNKGVATSGVNKRKWLKNNEVKNHIIDTRTNASVENRVVTVTVVSDSAVESDVYAKSLLVMGREEGLKFSEANKLASFFIEKDLKFYMSPEMEKYVWKK